MVRTGQVTGETGESGDRWCQVVSGGSGGSMVRTGQVTGGSGGQDRSGDRCYT